MTNERQTFRFKISLTSKIYRTIDINGEEDLYELASIIIEAFDFDLDHAFGFYNTPNGKYYNSTESYELFIDQGLEGSSGKRPLLWNS